MKISADRWMRSKSGSFTSFSLRGVAENERSFYFPVFRSPSVPFSALFRSVGESLRSAGKVLARELVPSDPSPRARGNCKGGRADSASETSPLLLESMDRSSLAKGRRRPRPWEGSLTPTDVTIHLLLFFEAENRRSGSIRCRVFPSFVLDRFPFVR